MPSDEDQEQDRRVDRRIAGLWDLIEVGHFPDSQLMEDLAWLLVLSCVGLAPLPSRQKTSGVRRHLPVEGKTLQRRYETVSTEEADEPRHPCCRRIPLHRD